MGINLVTYYNSTVTPQDDALIYENALPASGMIYGGNVTIKNANTLHITAGHGALCGRKFTIEEADIPVILTSSGTLNGRLYIHMDLSDTGSPISLEIERAASLTPVIQQSNVNINDGIYEINLATFQISTSTVSNLVNVAPFIKYEFAKEVIIAPVEKTSTASTAYAVGKHLIYNDILYRVTTAISSGGQINPGVNVVVSETIQNQIETNAGNISTANTNITNLSNNKANQTIIAPRQANATAATTYYAGDQFILNNVLYTATKTINSGTAINSGNSTASATIVSQISNLSNYSISEKPTNKLWIDGKQIYRKVVNFGALPNNDRKTVNHGISSISSWVSVQGVAWESSKNAVPLPHVDTDNSYSVALWATSTAVIIKTAQDRSSFTSCYVILEYTKT